MLKFRVGRSKNIPEYILKGISDKEETRNIQAKAEKEVQFREAYNSGVMKYAQACEIIDFVDHGFGVLEASNDGSVWYREDDTIRRKDDPHLKDVLTAIENGIPIDERIWEDSDG